MEGTLEIITLHFSDKKLNSKRQSDLLKVIGFSLYILVEEIRQNTSECTKQYNCKQNHMVYHLQSIKEIQIKSSWGAIIYL